ncbi:AAA domain-containing protein [Caulobacter sp. SL161]|uniref:AAA domain-containing protein n=1 Tax=Caulobacter sp. SL161 TaxID=2995156 RepID=UPI0022760AAE|nr:AAA domain-containing protein [Caulobacter sp. SL161]MCY1646663.1 AAA domain-containing protein [Caulobacter sp. SL161]
MSPRQLLTFLRDPKAFAAGAVDPDLWRKALDEFVTPQLKAKGEHALRAAQISAWQGLAATRAGLVLGPPGTGKTHLLSWLIVGYMQARMAAGLPTRVFVSAFTRNAIGNLLDAVAKRAQTHAPGAFDVRFIGAAPPAGLSGSIQHRDRVSNPAEADAAIADLQAPNVVMGGSIWSLARLMARPNAQGDRYTADIFDLVCIDEASQMVVSHGLMALAGLKDTGRLVVAGDDQQLPPIRSARDIRLDTRDLGGSLYTFLKSGEVPEFALDETFRLNGPLAEFPERVFYKDNYRSVDEVRLGRLKLIDNWQEGLEDWEGDLLDPDWPVAILLHDGPPASSQNPLEADIAARLAEHLATRMSVVDASGVVPPKFWEDDLAIVSPHRAQNNAIRSSLSKRLARGAFVETVDRIQGKERDAVIMSYCVADAEFALAEADFIFAPERLNVAITRAKTKLIVLISRRLLEAAPGDQEAMDKAEMLREFVFSAKPRRSVVLQNGAGGTVKAQVLLRGFDAAPVFEQTVESAPASSTDELTKDQERLLAAVVACAREAKNAKATIKALQHKLATQRGLLPDLSRLHALGWINLTESTRYGSFWQAAIVDPRRQVFTVDIDTVRARLEGVISQTRSGRVPPFYNTVRQRFAWMNGKGDDVLMATVERLKAEGLVVFGTANGAMTIDWVDLGVPVDGDPPAEPAKLVDEDFVVLNALETLEAATINFGVFEAWTSIASLADQAGLDREFVAAAVGRLAEHGWLMLADEGRVRSRVAELARELRYVKQRFKHDDADTRPYLVRSLKLELRDRDKPERREDIAATIGKAAEGLEPARQDALKALGDMLQRRWGADAAIAGFQARSLIALSQAWDGAGDKGFVIAADTGSGKTEAAAFPLIAGAAADRLRGVRGVRAILAYPRIRLATNQAQRLASYLADFAQQPGMPTVTLGLQIGPVPQSFDQLRTWDVDAGWKKVSDRTYTFPFFACPACEQELLLASGKGDDGADALNCTACSWGYKGWVGSKQGLRDTPPALFLPTTDSLHQWMHNASYGRIFGDDPEFAPPRAVLADEIHLYSHIHGAQVGFALRRLAARVAANAKDGRPLLAIGMSATLGDPAKAWERLVDRPTELITPRPDERTINPRGREYFFFVQPEVESRGKDIAGASTTIQSLMCLAHGMRRRTGSAGGYRSLVFLDSIDKVRRLHAAYGDAETFKKLAALRTRNYPDDPVNGQPRQACCGQPHGCDVFKEGECWWFAAQDKAQVGAAGRRRAGACLTVAEQPVFSGTSGRVEGMIKRSDIVFATSSLEVGYDDPDINLVYQHYAPRDLASFIQRKGRGGRGVDDRPITGVTLSLYSSRDTWWFRKPHEMISPAAFDSPLNPDNFFVRRGQILSSVLDAFARLERRGVKVDLEAPSQDAWLEAQTYVERLFGAKPWEQFRQASLAALWAKALKARSKNEVLDTPAKARALLTWIPTTLFESINLPHLTVKSAGAPDANEDIALALSTAAPGNATRRYDGVNVYWRPPIDGKGPWLAPEDYDYGDQFAVGEGAGAWLAQLPDEAKPLLTDLHDTYFRPKRLTLEVLGRMYGAGWQSDWEAGAGSLASVSKVGDPPDLARQIRHDSRGFLRGFPVLKPVEEQARPLPIEGLEAWLTRVDLFQGDGVGGKSTGLGLARVFWGADAEVPLNGPPLGSETFTQIFTAPGDDRPLLHGFHVQTEGVRYAINTDRLSQFVEKVVQELDGNAAERAWHEGQRLRYLLESKSIAAGVNAFEARRAAELLATIVADEPLLKRLKQVLRFWDKADIAALFEDARSSYLSQHPMLSVSRVARVADVYGAPALKPVLQAALEGLSDPACLRRYIWTAVVHALGMRLKESFVQTARGDERQVIMHARLPLQFEAVDEAMITICEVGSYGDGTTRTFAERFETSKGHWRDGFITDCPNAAEDQALTRLFAAEDQHAAWRALDPTNPATLRLLADALGLPSGAPAPPAVLRVLYGREQVGLERVDLYELAMELRVADAELRERLKREPTVWELVSAAVERARGGQAKTAARLLAAYEQVEDAALDDSLSPDHRLADQLYRLHGRLCVDGCQACVHQSSDLMSEGLVGASTSRSLLRRFVCEA